MSAKVVVFEPPEPNADVLELLEQAAREAIEGTASGVAVVIARRDGTVWSHYAGSDYHLINSGIARLAARAALEPGEIPMDGSVA